MSYQKFNLSVIALVALCALVLGSFNYVVDPYNKNRKFNFDLPKPQVSEPMHYPLFKTLEFAYQPKDTLLLGDSRTAALKAKYFKDLGNASVFNMAYGGGTAFEIIDSFWFAVGQHDVERVYIGMPFNVYSEANRSNRFKEAKALIEGSAAYYFSPFVAKTGVYNIASKIQGKNIKSEAPNMSKEQFWKFQLADLTSASYGSWQVSEELDAEFGRIVDYCESNDIVLTFFIPPTHVELQDKVTEFGLEKEYADFVATLSGMATLIDFDFPNTLTKDKSNFKDPYHFTADVGPFVVRALLELPVTQDERAYYRVIE